MKRIIATLFTMSFIFCVLRVARADSLPENSIYRLSETLVDDSGRKIALKSFQGTPVVFTFIYTTCKNACPLTVQRLQRLYQLLAEKRLRSRFVLVSLDPSHDSPAVLSEFRESHKLVLPQWQLLTGKQAQIRAISVMLGYSFQETGDDENRIAHSNRIVLLDKNGVIDTTLDGLNADVSTLSPRIEHLQK